MLKRYDHLLNETNRAGFVRKLVDYVSNHDLDGLDVDIEGPAINKDYGVFVADLSKELKPRGKLLTAALSKGYGGAQVPDSVFKQLDFVNIMAYDGAGYWIPNRPVSTSSFDYTKDNVTYWLDRGLPKSKAMLGVPFYGYGFGEAFRKRGLLLRSWSQSIQARSNSIRWETQSGITGFQPLRQRLNMSWIKGWRG